MDGPLVPNLLLSWGITADELSEIVSENPSMRGLMFGFVAEYKLKKEWLLRPGITNLVRPRSHDRKQKCDFAFDYRGINVRVEVKCLDTPKVRYTEGIYTGTFQCNASDTTAVPLPDGSNVVTNCLVVGGFDVLAACLFAFGNTWRFAFALNEDLPRTTWKGYTPYQQGHLLKSAMKISWPLQAPFGADLFAVLNRLARKRTRG
ncbi:MAG: hypothetical protein AAB403_14600 [Planctomycetota bacterium]